jgi:hypothetical protein
VDFFAKLLRTFRTSIRPGKLIEKTAREQSVNEAVVAARERDEARVIIFIR